MVEYPYAERLRSYRQEVDFCLESGEGPALRGSREVLAALDLTAGELAELADIDAGALDFILELDEIAPNLLEDDPAQPLKKWWWHLGKIRRGEYPAELLPAAIRPFYTATSPQPSE